MLRGVDPCLNRAAEGTQGNGSVGFTCVLDAAGRTVAFTSFASDLVPGDTNDENDPFLRDVR